MPTSLATIDALNSLLEAEVNSIFNFVGEGSAFVRQASPEVRRELAEMLRHLEQHERDLSDLIRVLGGEPSNPPSPNPEDEYLSFLPLKSLIPKLIDAKKLMIERYDHALGAVEGNERAIAVLQSHLAEMKRDLAALERLTHEAPATK